MGKSGPRSGFRQASCHFREEGEDGRQRPLVQAGAVIRAQASPLGWIQSVRAVRSHSSIPAMWTIAQEAARSASELVIAL
jgi:hypothetical protein